MESLEACLHMRPYCLVEGGGVVCVQGVELLVARLYCFSLVSSNEGLFVLLQNICTCFNDESMMPCVLNIDGMLLYVTKDLLVC